MSFPHLETVYCLRLRKNVRDPHLKEIRPVGDESYTESLALGDANLDDDMKEEAKGRWKDKRRQRRGRKKKKRIKKQKSKTKERKGKDVNRDDEDDETRMTRRRRRRTHSRQTAESY